MNKSNRTPSLGVAFLAVAAMALCCMALQASESEYDEYDDKSWLVIMDENKTSSHDDDGRRPGGGGGSSGGSRTGSSIGPGIGSGSSASSGSSSSSSGNANGHSNKYYQQQLNAYRNQMAQIEADQRKITEYYDGIERDALQRERDHAARKAMKQRYQGMRDRARAIGQKCWSRHIDTALQQSNVFVRHGLERAKGMFHAVHHAWAAAPDERAAHDVGTRAWNDWAREMERGMGDYERALNAAWSAWVREMRRRADSANDRMVRDAVNEQIALARRAFEGKLADEKAAFRDEMAKAHHEWNRQMSAARAKRNQRTPTMTGHHNAPPPTERKQALRDQACHIGHVLWGRHMGPAKQVFFANARLGQGKAKLVVDAIHRAWVQSPDGSAADEFGKRAWDNWAREMEAGLGRWEQAMHAAWNAWEREMRAKAASTGDPAAREAIYEQITVARRDLERELADGKAAFRKDMASAQSNWQQQMAQARNARHAQMLAASHRQSPPGNVPRTHHEFETAADVTPNPFRGGPLREADATDHMIDGVQMLSKYVPILNVPAAGTQLAKEAVEHGRAEALDQTRRMDPEARPVPRHRFAGAPSANAVETVAQSGGTAWLGADGFWYYVTQRFYTPRSPHAMILDAQEVAPGVYQVVQRGR